MERDELLEKLTILDFMSTDISLYLNTHPNDNEALRKYNLIVNEANKIRCIYEKKYGPICSYRSVNQADRWNWIDDPWPWCEKFNFELRGVN